MTDKPHVLDVDAEVLRQLCLEYLLQRDEPWQFGFEGDVQSTAFVNLMAAAHVDTNLEAMSDIMSRFVQRHIDSQNYCIVGPKRGNVLLQREVARRLQKPSAFALDPPLFGRWIEGIVSPDCEAVVVDDIGSESDILLCAIERLRDCGHLVRSAFVLLNRADGDAVQVLARHGVQLHYVISASGDELSAMATRSNDVSGAFQPVLKLHSLTAADPSSARNASSR